MSTKERLYKCSNAIMELSQLLSDRLWNDDNIKDRFVLAALADGIHSAAAELDDLAKYLHDPGDNGLQSPDNETVVTA